MTDDSISRKIEKKRAEIREAEHDEKNDREEDRKKKEKDDQERDNFEEALENLIQQQAQLFNSLTKPQKDIAEEYMSNMKNVIDKYGARSREAREYFKTIGLGNLDEKSREEWAKKHMRHGEWKKDTDWHNADFGKMERENRRHRHERAPDGSPDETAAKPPAARTAVAARNDGENFKNAPDVNAAFGDSAKGAPKEQAPVTAPDKQLTATTVIPAPIPGSTS